MLFDVQRSQSLEGDAWVLGVRYGLPEGTCVPVLLNPTQIANGAEGLLVDVVFSVRKRRDERGREIADMVFVQEELSGNRLARSCLVGA